MLRLIIYPRHLLNGWHAGILQLTIGLNGKPGRQSGVTLSVVYTYSVISSSSYIGSVTNSTLL